MAKDYFYQQLNFDMEVGLLEELIEKLLLKMQKEFSEADQAFKFFDLDHNQKVRMDYFWFCFYFLGIKLEMQELRAVFQILDSNQKGYLDQDDLKALYEGKARNTEKFNEEFAKILERRSVIQRNKFKFPKTALGYDEMLSYPHYYK